MRRFDKKVHMERVNLLFEERCITETISPSEAYTDWDSMMSVLRGKRSVAFLMGPFIKKWYKKYLKGHPTAKLLTIERDGDGYHGNAYVLYTDLEKAKKLKTLLDSQTGYATTWSPELTIANGEALEYHDSDIKDFVDNLFGEGSYDKVKNNYEKI